MMNSSPDLKLSKQQRVLATIVIISVFYLNIAEIMEVSCLGVSLPRPYAAAQLFHMFSLWHTYTEWNSGYEAEALAVGTQADTGERKWITIDVHEYLPSIHGHANRLLSIDDGSGWQNRQKYDRDYAHIVDVFQSCHNRAHPETPVDHMRLYYVWWPSNRMGYFQQYDQRSRRLLYAKP